MPERVFVSAVDAAFEDRRGELWMLPAIALADERGHVVVLCSPTAARPIAGTQQLSTRYAIVGDGMVGIDSQGGIVAYGANHPSGDRERRAELASSLRLSKIVLAQSEVDGPDYPEVETLELGLALELLAPLSEFLCDLPAALRTLESILDATGGALRVRYREGANLDSLLADLMDTAPSSRPLKHRARSHGALHADHQEASVEESSTRSYYRAGVLDVVILDEARVAVLRRGSAGGELRILNGIAVTLWNAADGGSYEALRAVVTTECGSRDGEDIGEILDDALIGMVNEGLLSDEPSWSIADDVAWTDSQSSTTVLSLDDSSQQPLALVGSSAVIWSILADGIALSQSTLIEECAAAFDVDPAEIAADVIALLHGLHARGVVVQI